MKEVILENKENTSSSVRKKRIESFVTKIICLLVAFFIWFYVSSNDVTTLKKDFYVGIKYENETELTDKTGWCVLSDKTGEIKVTLSGRKSVISKLTSDDIEVSVDVSKVEKAGENNLEIMVSAPTDCQIIGKSTDSVQVYVEKRVQKNIGVSSEITNYLSTDCELESSVKPGEITIAGPESVISNIEKAKAVADFEGKAIKETTSKNCKVVLVDKNGNEINSEFVTLFTSTVNVITEPFVTKEVPVKVSGKYGFFNETNAKITISPEKISLRGSPGVMENINEVYVSSLDEKQFVDSGSLSYPITIPDNVENISKETSAKVTVEHINTTKKSFVLNNIELVNTNGLDAKLKANKITVVLRGPYSALSKIKNENIEAKVNLEAYTAGQGETVLPVEISINSEYNTQVYEVGSYNVSLVIN